MELELSKSTIDVHDMAIDIEESRESPEHVSINPIKPLDSVK